jgi:protein MAK16
MYLLAHNVDREEFSVIQMLRDFNLHEEARYYKDRTFKHEYAQDEDGSEDNDDDEDEDEDEDNDGDDYQDEDKEKNREKDEDIDIK